MQFMSHKPNPNIATGQRQPRVANHFKAPLIFIRTVFIGCIRWFKPGHCQQSSFIIIHRISTSGILTN